MLVNRRDLLRCTVLGLGSFPLVFGAGSAHSANAAGDLAETVEGLVMALANGPDVVAFSTSCPGWENAVQRGQLEKMLNTPACTVIVMHGLEGQIDARDYPEWDFTFLWHETPGIFVHSTNDVRGVSDEELKKILTGEVKDWSEISSFSGRIRVFALDREVQRNVFRAMIERAALPAAAVEANIDFVPSTYSQLLRAVANDPTAICVGLRESYSEQIKPVRLNGALPYDSRSSVQGAFAVPKSVAIRRTEYAHSIAVRRLPEILKRRSVDQLYYYSLNQSA